MSKNLIKEGTFRYTEAGEGQPIIVLHGLMGELSNFDGVFNYFSENGYKVIIPELPIYKLPILKTNVKNLSKFLKEFMVFNQQTLIHLDKITVALYYSNYSIRLLLLL